MAEQAYDDTYVNGTRTSRTPRTVSDVEILKRDAPLRLKQSYSVLRQWALDAETAVGTWDAATQAQKNATMKVVLTRFGKLCDGMSDLMLDLSRDS